MKHIIFASVIALTAAVAAAKGAPNQAWNHANDAGPIAGLTQVEQSQGMRFKKIDRTEYVAPATGVHVDDSYQSLRREGNR